MAARCVAWRAIVSFDALAITAIAVAAISKTQMSSLFNGDLWSQSPIVYINSALYFNLNEFFWTLYDINSGALNQPLSTSTVHCLICTYLRGHCIFYFYFCFYSSYMQCDCHCILL